MEKPILDAIVIVLVGVGVAAWIMKGNNESSSRSSGRENSKGATVTYAYSGADDYADNNAVDGANGDSTGDGTVGSSGDGGGGGG